MAASGKTTAVHFSLIFFVMLSIILGVVAYLNFKDLAEQQALVKSTDDRLQVAEAALKGRITEVDALKTVIGYPDLPEVGATDPAQGTVIREAQNAIANYGTDPASQQLVDALQKVRAEYDKKIEELGQARASLADASARVASLRSDFDARRTSIDSERARANDELVKVESTTNELLKTKDSQIEDLRKQLNDAQFELNQTRAQLTAQLRDLNEDMVKLRDINDGLRDKLAAIQNFSFAKPDGKIVRVDQVSRLVWIDLGEADNLRRRINFSVYKKDAVEIARDREDIIGSIEVVRLISPHLAEARILKEDLARPMAPGDSIYTPVWSPGQTEKFAFVGLIDMDNDGNHTKEDRERLHELLWAAGAKISSETLEDGERVGESELDITTRFLVVGHTPDPVTDARPSEQPVVQKLMTHRREMLNEARLNGIRVVSLNQFKDYIGYVPKRRLWAPGMQETWTLKSGSRNDPSGDQTDPSSTGRVSGLFYEDERRERDLRPNSSSGQASSLFNK
ncbi:hypothetical protein [Stratiformator vulcanicus]|uniref:Uncharacterized protein n=1 Tax=Stratiformator vulcanicus TaxID=2527980 RepID=A0A517R652_9PLAN|nr:hypothetical protein [Stratiformator vulcanicus]QDT39377.1 hypothetical protein Pan189_37840 [Stratiformator vulcanicus]